MDTLAEQSTIGTRLTPDLNLQQQVLASGVLNGKTDATVNFKLDADRNKHLKISYEKSDFPRLVEKFKGDPKTCLAIARENLRAITSDSKLTEPEKNSRIRRYVDSYLGLIVELDRSAFPPTPGGAVQRGIPDYIPDGLSDMGSDSNTDTVVRNREKIRIDKAKIFEQSKELFYDVFSRNFDPSVSSSRIKQYMTERVAHFVYTKMPYYRKNDWNDGRSMLLDEIVENQLAVCRHHALMTQVLLQAFGLTSTLMKSDVNFNGRNAGPHANNLVRIDGQWLLLDTTNPEKDTRHVYLQPLPEKDIDLNNQRYRWEFRTGSDVRTYTSRNNMYYRIMDNVKNPAG